MPENKFTDNQDGFVFSQCNSCKHRLKSKQCTAFKEIPSIILANQFDHTNPYLGDNGIQFEEIEDTNA